MYDVIIVGGGAVGLYLGKEFAKKGNLALVLERKDKIGGKLCSGLVSSRLFKLLEPGKENFYFIEKKFSKARIWIGETFFDLRGRAWLVNRQKFDEYLSREARKSGAKISLETEVIKAREEKEFVRVFLKSGKEIEGRILAGCDGALSTVAKDCFLFDKRQMLLGVITYEQMRKGQQLSDGFPELFFLKEFPGFFAWRIPRRTAIEWGTALPPQENPRERLEKFLNGRRIKYQIFKSAFIPLPPLRKTISERIFLCGDAAGQIKPATGGGLVYGILAAKIASKVIDPRRPSLKLYERRWREKIQKEIFFGNLIRKSYSLPNFFKKIALSLLKNKKNLDQDKPSTIFPPW